jgi:hypothetical protein
MCKENILTDVVKKQDLTWDGQGVYRRCGNCGCQVLLFSQGACKCNYWGPFRSYGAHYCDAPATRVLAIDRDAICIEFFCDKHLGPESRSWFEGWGLSSAIVACVLSVVFAMAATTGIVAMLGFSMKTGESGEAILSVVAPVLLVVVPALWCWGAYWLHCMRKRSATED